MMSQHFRHGLFSFQHTESTNGVNSLAPPNGALEMRVQRLSVVR